MNREDFVLGCLSIADGADFSPVHVQKIFFLLDRELSNELGFPYFDFKPYHYGPFDKEVYEGLEYLQSNGLVDIDFDSNHRCYRLTVKGQEAGIKIFSEMPLKVKTYVKEVIDFVRSISFVQLVASIYNAYPEMRENSVFHG